MKLYIHNFFTTLIDSTDTATLLTNITFLLILVIISFLAKWIVDRIIIKVITKYIKNNQFTWDEAFLERRVLQKLSHLIPAIIIYNTAYLLDTVQIWIQKATLLYIIIMLVLFVISILNALHDIYQKLEISKTKPIKIFIQVAGFLIWMIGGILIISLIFEQNPLLLLSGIGAMTAILLLIFKDSILGFVAGIQIGSNDMIRIGDWIELPSSNANGEVKEISLVTVKVQNFDKSIVSIPTYALISNSFTNWRGMFDSGGRRIKRSIYIDMNSIKICDKKMIEKFKKIHYLTEYIHEKNKEIETYNKENNIDKSVEVNGRAMTNIGTFRYYLEQYLANHPNIKKDFIKMVRQLPAEENGLPIEIYAFSTTTVWVEYENIQSDIFDHILAIAPHFDLKVFQNPSGSDFKEGISNKK